MTTLLATQEKKEKQTLAQTVEKVFNRYEKKYLVDSKKTEALIYMLGNNLVQDKRGSTVIRNLFLDTPDFLLTRRSVEKPLYKEKLRVRTYGAVDNSQHEAFLEIKKKFDGQVYKRRIDLSLANARRFVEGEIKPTTQIARELDWSIKSYHSLGPAISVVYERLAYAYPGMDGNVRITVDSGLAAKLGRWDDFMLPFDSPEYQQVLADNQYVMEIKVLGAMPLMLAWVLSELEIYPTSFSKVGRAYSQLAA